MLDFLYLVHFLALTVTALTHGPNGILTLVSVQSSYRTSDWACFGLFKPWFRETYGMNAHMSSQRLVSDWATLYGPDAKFATFWCLDPRPVIPNNEDRIRGPFVMNCTSDPLLEMQIVVINRDNIARKKAFCKPKGQTELPQEDPDTVLRLSMEVKSGTTQCTTLEKADKDWLKLGFDIWAASPIPMNKESTHRSTRVISPDGLFSGPLTSYEHPLIDISWLQVGASLDTMKIYEQVEEIVLFPSHDNIGESYRACGHVRPGYGNLIVHLASRTMF